MVPLLSTQYTIILVGKRFVGSVYDLCLYPFNPKEMDYLEIQELKRELNKERQEQVAVYFS